MKGIATEVSDTQARHLNVAKVVNSRGVVLLIQEAVLPIVDSLITTERFPLLVGESSFDAVGT